MYQYIATFGKPRETLAQTLFREARKHNGSKTRKSRRCSRYFLFDLEVQSGERIFGYFFPRLLMAQAVCGSEYRKKPLELGNQKHLRYADSGNLLTSCSRGENLPREILPSNRKIGMCCWIDYMGLRFQ